MTLRLPGAAPEVPVTDLKLSIDYYRQHLGFGLDWSDATLGLAGISRGDCRLFLADAGFRRGYGNTGPALTWLNLESKAEVDELYRDWSAAGARLLSAPDSKTWGLHEFTAADPDGNMFRVFFDFGTGGQT